MRDHTQEFHVVEESGRRKKPNSERITFIDEGGKLIAVKREGSEEPGSDTEDGEA